MDEELWSSGPSVKKISERGVAEALTRNGVNPASALSADIRSRVVIVWPRHSEPAILVIDETNSHRTLDEYIEAKKTDPAYVGSFIPSPAKAQIRVTDQRALFAADLEMVARGEIEIIDDRATAPFRREHGPL